MKSAVIYGATTTGKYVYEKIKHKYNVEYFVDGNPAIVNTKIKNLPVCERQEIFKTNPDIVVMGLLTGYEEAVKYLIDNKYPEEKILCQYVDLNSRARRDYLEKASIILKEKKIEGAVAELGVYRGDFAKIINEIFFDRDLYLFDTFNGFPDQDMVYEIENALLLNNVEKFSNTSVNYVLSRMLHPEKCIIKRGYFPDTTVGLKEGKYAFVNIDVDLYKPIVAGLEYFWPRMSENGYILVHDYFSFSYSGSQKAINEFSKKYNVGFTPIGDTLSVAFVKGDK